jgi:dienelactone hydrolase
MVLSGTKKENIPSLDDGRSFVGYAGKFIFSLAVLIAFSINISAQKKISFVASDRLIVTADQYLTDNEAPYILLFHQGNSSRGEFREIAPRLQKLGFNCLAVDLRNGKEQNFVKNETAIRAKENNIPATIDDCEKDILATIDYISKTALNNKCVLFGSSFSASLAMKVANHNKKVTAVISFSPGEYFTPAYQVREWLKDFDKPVFVACSKREYPFVKELTENIPQQNLTLYQPSPDDDIHGAPALWKNNPSSGEYWTSLLMFVKKVKDAKYKPVQKN